MSTCSILSTEKLQELLDAWVAAELAITTGQNYSIEGVSVSRADLATVTARINELTRELCNRQRAAAGIRVGVLTPRWS